MLTFKPWMFSGRGATGRAFFEQVAGQLRLKGKREGVLATPGLPPGYNFH